jgi:hypothetical protein
LISNQARRLPNANSSAIVPANPARLCVRWNFSHDGLFRNVARAIARKRHLLLVSRNNQHHSEGGVRGVTICCLIC